MKYSRKPLEVLQRHWARVTFFMKLTGQEEWKSMSGQESDVLQELANIRMHIPLSGPHEFIYTTDIGKPLDPKKSLKENGVVSGTEIKVSLKMPRSRAETSGPFDRRTGPCV